LKAISHNVDGIISFLDTKEEIEELIEGYQVPVLLLGRSTTLRNVDCVFADDITGGFLVGQKFIEKGCKNPLYIFLLPFVCLQLMVTTSRNHTINAVLPLSYYDAIS